MKDFPRSPPGPRRARGRRAALAAALLFGLLPARGRAEVLVLVNGDSIQGTLAREEAGVYVWLSPLLGEIRVSRSDVRELRPDPPPRPAPEAARTSAADISSLTTNRLVSVDVRSFTGEAESANPFPPRLTLSRVNLDFAGKDSAGNDDQTRLTLDLNGRFRHLRNRHFVQAEYDVETRDGERTADERNLGYMYSYFLGGPWLAYLAALREEDRFLDLQQRLTGRAGPGYEVYDTPVLRWALETGLAYQYENFVQDDDRRFWGWHYGMDWRWLISALGLELFHNHTLMQSFDQGTDWEINTETGMRYHLVGGLKAMVKLKYDYDHLPALNKDRMDRVWLFGLSFGF